MLQAVAHLKEQHKKDLAAAARRHEEAVQMQQRDAKKQLAEQGRAVAIAEKAVHDANDASKQASQVSHLNPGGEWWLFICRQAQGATTHLYPQLNCEDTFVLPFCWAACHAAPLLLAFARRFVCGSYLAVRLCSAEVAPDLVLAPHLLFVTACD